ncbi:MAG TPA: glycosyltransferase [Flavobacterium sp.]|jgi:uncharacterized protein (TIGR00661 family)
MEPKSTPSLNILVAPLNWGLGHATRCIPVIKALQSEGFNPILASDGAALELLRKEFPKLQSLELPSYNISYPKNPVLLKWKMFISSPHILSSVTSEKKLVSKWVKEYNLSGIISDNRFGVYNKSVPSVYITHQLNVLSGTTTWLTSKIHRFIIKRYDECWIPDVKGINNLSGNLGHPKKLMKSVKYIGLLSRFEKKSVPIKYDLMVLLSGPEPHRSLLEQKLRQEISSFSGKILFVCGKLGEKQLVENLGNLTFYNYMLSDELQDAINSSEIILCRSGYSTIMDMATLQKKVFFIPTAGQYEQQYLAEKLKQDGLVAFTSQKDFKIEDLVQTDLYRGLKKLRPDTALHDLFSLFKGKRKF